MIFLQDTVAAVPRLMQPQKIAFCFLPKFCLFPSGFLGIVETEKNMQCNNHKCICINTIIQTRGKP